MLRRFLQHSVVLVYLLLTFGALFFTMTKVEFPLPERIIHWNYGMIAPYQGDTPWSADFVYEGELPDGTRHVVNIDPYMPYGFGERNVRKFLRIYQYLGPLGHRRKFADFAYILLQHERDRGHPYTTMRVYFEQWDRSPAGYDYLRTPLFTHRELVTTIQ